MGDFDNFFGHHFINWILVIELEARAYHFVCNAHDPCGFWIVLQSMEIRRDWHDFAPCLQAGARSGLSATGAWLSAAVGDRAHDMSNKGAIRVLPALHWGFECVKSKECP